MKIIELKTPETQAAIECFLCKSKALLLAKKAFFNDWAKARSQKEALLVANDYTHYFIGDITTRVDAEYAFDKMQEVIENEISNYPFQSIHWRY